MPTLPQDIAALEAAMWADISDRLAVGAARTSAVEVTEQLARCDLVAQRAAYVTALSTSLACRALQCARKAAAEASDAAREALAWGKVSDVATDQAATVAKETSIAIQRSGSAPPVAADGDDGFETRLAHAKEEMSVAETRVLELHTREAAAEASVEAKKRAVADLDAEAAHLREAVARLRREEADADRSLTERRNGSLGERRELEMEASELKIALRNQREELESLKADVVVERERLAAARETADAAVKTTALAMDRVASQAEAELARTGSASAHPGDTSNTTTNAAAPMPMTSRGGEGAAADDDERREETHHHPERRMESSGSAGPTPGQRSRPPTDEPSASFESHQPSSPRRAYAGGGGNNEQTIESGLAALQNVRNQLRELRGPASPPTAGGAPPPGNNNSFPSYRQSSPPRSTMAASSPSGGGGGGDGTGTLRRAATYASYGSPSSSSSQHPSLIGSARLQTSASMILESNSAAGPSPWKSRLLKLQGDLRTLRSELGATSSGSPARGATA